GGFPLNRAPSSLSDLVSDTLESFSELAYRESVKLEGKVEADVDPVFMDTQAIGRVLNNLISNALRHTSAGGEIRVHAWKANSGVEVSVRDTGEGIPAQDIPHIFERFYRGDAARSRNRGTGGAGLGLAIARAHGGDIRVQSQVGNGTQFTFHIP